MNYKYCTEKFVVIRLHQETIRGTKIFLLEMALAMSNLSGFFDKMVLALLSNIILNVKLRKPQNNVLWLKVLYSVQS
ncbi:MAG: hypothetical protein EAZ92_11890 [Candidatus Kapaibacterium sp.]|nr:MAG: hypothetical protein EAZ92_11890 [Candidatus Kapabacteria bacterium]